jgi:signal transduction histidine kinase
MTVSVTALRQCALFDGLSDDDLALAARLGEQRKYPAGATLFSEEQEARHLWVLSEGTVALEKKIQLGPSSTPRPATLEVLNAGEAFGWSALVEPYVYTTTAVSLTPCSTIMIDGPSLRLLLEAHPRMGYFIMEELTRVVATRFRETANTLSYFLSIISHELKAPLAAVENYMHVILSGYAGTLTRSQQNMLERSCLRLQELSSLIGNVLDLARMRPEQIRTDFQPTVPNDILVESLEDILLQAKDKKIDLEVDVPVDLPPIVCAQSRLRQVFTNLLSNAVKFTPEQGRVTLRVLNGGDNLRAEVIDSGPGIPAADLPHIFVDFYRSSAAEAPGLGLGLAIAKRIVEAHRGQIWVESPYPADGQGGSRFVLIIPKDPEHAARQGVAVADSS